MEPDGSQTGHSKAVDAIVEELAKQSQKSHPRNDESPRSGTISANGDTEIRALSCQAMEKVGNEGVITVERQDRRTELAS